MSRVKIVNRGSTCCVDSYLNPHSKFLLPSNNVSLEISTRIQTWIWRRSII